MIRQNIAGRLVEWNAQFESFAGSTAEMLATAMQQWWDQLGATKASGISKLVFAEASNFPDLAAFYREEVVVPGLELVRAVLQRGVERGEFRPVASELTAHSVIAPLIFLVMWRHSIGPCCPPGETIEPETFIRQHAQLLLRGLAA